MENNTLVDLSFHNTTTAPGVGYEYLINGVENTINLAITGTATAFVVVFEGQVSNSWLPIEGRNLSTGDIGSQVYIKDEIWQVEVSGLTKFRCRIKSIAGGNLSVLGRAWVDNNEMILRAMPTCSGPGGGDYTLPVATATVLGGVKKGNNVTIDASGVLSVAAPYVHPTTHPASMIIQDTTHRFITDAEKTSWNGKQDALPNKTGHAGEALVVDSLEAGFTYKAITSGGGTVDLTDIENQLKWLSYDLKAFGCLGNDSNEGAKIASIVNAIPHGATLHIPYGTFNLGGITLTVNKPMSIVGPGTLKNGKILISNTSNVKMMGINTEAVYMEINTSTQVTITGCKFDNLTKDVLGFIYMNTNCSEIEINDNRFSNIYFVTSMTTYGCAVKIEATGKTLSDIFIERNEMYNISGPAVIWIGLANTTFNRLVIKDNIIHDTGSFGIEFYNTSNLSFTDCIVDNNNIYNTGSIRKVTYGNGCGGIYINTPEIADIKVTNNVLKHITECGIEGKFALVSNNYIEDTGCDQLNRIIKDSSGIYDGGQNIINNIIINPGEHGGMYLFSSDYITDKNIKGNTIRNIFSYWKSRTAYSAGDLVVSENNWYICKQSGTSGTTAPSGTTANISDGSCKWDYKKPFARYGIFLNAVSGIENIAFEDNMVYELDTCLLSSSWNKNISVSGNVHQCDLVSKYAYFGGYGSRNCEGLVYDKPTFMQSNVPTTGTWNQGDQVINSNVSAGGYIGWVCIISGSFGSLSGVTGSISANSTSLVVNNSSSLHVGDFISIAGVSGARQISMISKNTVTINYASNATVSNASISYFRPTFKGYGLIQG